MHEQKVLAWVRFGFLILSLIAYLVFLVMSPKVIIPSERTYQIATSQARIDSESLLLYDYFVFATENRFIASLENDFPIILEDFKERGELVAVQIPGDRYTVEVNDDYLLITNPQTPELNIEYYLVRDMQIADINIPIRTFNLLFSDLIELINSIYLGIYVVIMLLILGSLSTKLTINVLSIKSLYKSN